MMEFVRFLQNRVFNPQPIPGSLVESSFHATVRDVRYHFPSLTEDDIRRRVESGENELAVFLFRLGQHLLSENDARLRSQIHWLLKEMCSCEIYFNNVIDVGLYVVHGEGTVIGSRNRIGRGFKVHHGCTVGHRSNAGGAGNSIGNNVTMYCNSSVVGELHIGDNVTIGAHVLVTKDVLADEVLTASPNH